MGDYRHCGTCGTPIYDGSHCKNEGKFGQESIDACHAKRKARLADGLSGGRTYFIVGDDGLYGPFTEEQMPEQMLRVSSSDSFGGFGGAKDVLENGNRLATPHRGLWAVIKVDVLVPNPVDVVKAWELPRDES